MPITLNDDEMVEIEALAAQIRKVQAENNRLRSTVTFYANESNWPEAVYADQGRLARIACGAEAPTPADATLRPRGRP